MKKDTKEIFYVGIGNDNKRPYSKKSRSSFWKSVVNKHDYIVDIVCNNVSWKEAGEIEKFLIFSYGRRDLSLGTLINLTDGGCGWLGGKHTEESKKNISNKNKGRVVSQETRDKISKANKGRKCSKETKLKLSKMYKGKKLSEKDRLRLLSYSTGRKHLDSTKEKISLSNGIPVVQLSKEGNFIRSYRNAKYAGEKLKICHSNITAVCKGKRTLSGGYKWKYKNGEFK